MQHILGWLSWDNTAKAELGNTFNMTFASNIKKARFKDISLNLAILSFSENLTIIDYHNWFHSHKNHKNIKTSIFKRDILCSESVLKL